MAKVEIYTANYCPYCTRAKMLFDNKGVVYTEHDVTDDEQARNDLVEKSGGRKTIPQIFIDGKHYGGFDDINALNQQGKLDEILSA